MKKKTYTKLWVVTFTNPILKNPWVQVRKCYSNKELRNCIAALKRRHYNYVVKGIL